MDPLIIEQTYVTQVYDQIADQFDHTRHKIWPLVRKFLDEIPITPQVKIADIGCGNGKNMLLRPHDMIGLDNSPQLVKICQQKHLNVQLGSILQIPFKDDEYDYTLCIAVLHHLVTLERRQKAVSELLRITKSGGHLLIYVWSVDTLAKITNVQHSLTISAQDYLIPWQKDYLRYYHLFLKGELEALFETHPEVTILKSFKDCDNWCIICQKN